QRDGDLADVMQQQPEAELVQAALHALDVTAAAVVLPAAAREQLAAEEDAERADVDAVLMGVGVGRGEVAEDDRGPGVRGDAGHDAFDDGAERLRGLRRQWLAVDE